ncbi:hypothetical protein APHCR_0724 [Anaplasma phagocytophilum str. CR1007]|uniref:Uncharacterized protein n=1 Tax=Anaplasma phagocytophilum (strain HZ) TaxID=212042 RepID=Q2GIS2_ANAPZ|nr:hypothetical protein APH_1196 [Anaplasma phagocytophilum str. HZ]AGR79683.1 hypothetical protein YYU_05520 [Anaplasma phagocytophilum str. HZ2]AGR80942.1 hypothetical protein WSQ_05575 [Anaplasma phagocytophilum str. JM]AGR82199.1 hypothetical protein YYY_05590 [Anaplasma phagocytophilum str. Dog2]KJZ98869.1 hypothetical protein APHCR_0724 [Anaplasma phagocytophilum str. CR1007]
MTIAIDIITLPKEKAISKKEGLPFKENENMLGAVARAKFA